MRRIILGLALAFGMSAPASASVVARVSNSAQRMHVYVDGRLAHLWPVSTARRGFVTPPGSYRVHRMHRMWHSRKYHMSPMPYAMFFRGGYAIHGTGAVGALGGAPATAASASHRQCAHAVQLDPALWRRARRRDS